MQNNNILWRHSEQAELEYRNETELFCSSVFCLLAARTGRRCRSCPPCWTCCCSKSNLSLLSLWHFLWMWNKNHHLEKKKGITGWTAWISWMLIWFVLSERNLFSVFSINIVPAAPISPLQAVCVGSSLLKATHRHWKWSRERQETREGFVKKIFIVKFKTSADEKHINRRWESNRWGREIEFCKIWQ